MIPEGLYEVRFVNTVSDREKIYIQHTACDTRGHPVFVIGGDGTVYNWNTIISVKRLGE